MTKTILIKDVQQYFSEKGCVLISEVFVNGHSRLEYQCSCGRPGSTSWNNFKKSSRCKACGRESQSNKRRTSLEKARSSFEKYGFTLIDSEYKNNLTPLEVECKKGHRSTVRMGNIQSGQGCRICGIEERSAENHYKWILDRQVANFKKNIRSKCASLLRNSLKATGKKKETSTAKSLGYGPKELRSHLESHSNWEIVKNGKWHIDHIFPIKGFVDYHVHNLRIINALENLRPISAEENLKKRDTYDLEAFEAWLLAR